ncbi:MAG: hypothetical protein ACRCXE_02970, partial [Metamycoplasmataceae bacterium]
DLTIEKLALIDWTITINDIIGDNFKSVATLRKLFTLDGRINQQTITSILDVTINDASETNRIITLTAKPGFTINQDTTITSNVFVMPTNYIIQAQSIAPSDIIPSDIVDDKHKDFAVLNKLFIGADFNQTNLENTEITLVTVVQDSKYKIELTPRGGFNINGSKDVVTSAEFTVFIKDIPVSLVDTMPRDIKASDLENQELMHTRAFLEKLFVFGSQVTQEDLNKLEIRVNNISAGIYSITLLPTNKDITINGGASSFDSNPFLSEVNVAITPNALPSWTLTFDDLDGNAWKELVTIEKLFTFDIPIHSQEHFDEMFQIQISGDPTMVITLNARVGFTINDGTTITSHPFEKPVNYLIGVRTDHNNANIRLSEVIVGDGYKNFSVISKLFNGTGITEASLANMNIELIEKVPNLTYQIKLTPNDGFNFNGNKQQIISEEFTIKFFEENIELDPSSTVPHDLTLADVQDLNKIKSKVFLSRFFVIGEHRDQAWIDNTLIVSAQHADGNTWYIKLQPKTMDIKLNGGNEFKSKAFDVVIPLFMGGLLPTQLPLTTVDINQANLGSLETLSRLFDMGSLTQAQINEGLEVTFIADGNGHTGKIQLQAKMGYKIVTNNIHYLDILT